MNTHLDCSMEVRKEGSSINTDLNFDLKSKSHSSNKRLAVHYLSCKITR